MALASGAAFAKTLATVDGAPLTEADLAAASEGLGPRAELMLRNPKTRRQLIEHLIDTKVLAKAGEAAGVDKSPEFQAKLAEAKAQLLATAYQKAYVAERTKDADVEAFFKKDPTRFSKKELRASHIILESEAKAKAVLAEAQKPGVDFEALAKQHSTGPSGAKGGDLGYFSRGRMVPEFEAAAFATPQGSVHPVPVQTSFGWHVLKVVDVRGSDDVKLADVKADVKEALEAELKASLVQELRTKAKVAIDEAAMKSVSF